MKIIIVIEVPSNAGIWLSEIFGLLAITIFVTILRLTLMAYYPDLTHYQYRTDRLEDKTVNVGWLSNQRTYSEGETSPDFCARLLLLCKGLVNPTRGWHNCEFCESSPFDPRFGNPLKPFGSAEIRVFYQDKVYAAPNLIYHYVTQHNYKPPEEFIEAVLNAPLPDSSEYIALMNCLGADYRIVDLE
ncbi:MAG: hypothetical protein KDE58_03225 [Caldilineaceae bacterium]|nr:hypothetical protein [Caldilineaceae bacterium]